MYSYINIDNICSTSKKNSKNPIEILNQNNPIMYYINIFQKLLCRSAIRIFRFNKEMYFLGMINDTLLGRMLSRKDIWIHMHLKIGLRNTFNVFQMLLKVILAKLRMKEMM